MHEENPKLVISVEIPEAVRYVERHRDRVHVRIFANEEAARHALGDKVISRDPRNPDQSRCSNYPDLEVQPNGDWVWVCPPNDACTQGCHVFVLEPRGDWQDKGPRWTEPRGFAGWVRCGCGLR